MPGAVDDVYGHLWSFMTSGEQEGGGRRGKGDGKEIEGGAERGGEEGGVGERHRFAYPSRRIGAGPPFIRRHL